MPARRSHVERPSTQTPPLEEYDRKRDFEKTPEPPGVARPRTAGALTFVVQKHAARRLHYDLRLEWDGVMPSWAVPKGPSLNPADKHLAVHVEDHPLDYATFEGVIPRGEYGGGQVIVWDDGTYSPDEPDSVFHDREEAERRMRAGLAAGKLSITFRGKKLKGSWALVRTNKVEAGKEQWLLIKHRDATADPDRDLIAENRSVRSGLSIEDIKGGLLPPASGRNGVSSVRPEDLPGARLAPVPADAATMQSESRNAPFEDRRWLFEPKLDGVRTLAFVRAGAVELRSRRGLDSTRQYPSVVAGLQRQPAHQLILDGEIVALDERGVPSFQLLQERIHLTGDGEIARAEARIPVIYYVFDLLYLDGVDLRDVPLEDRRETLARVLLPAPSIRLVEPFEVDGITAFEIARTHDLEGLVAKKRDSVYESGRRSRNWLKVKTRNTDEFVVGGFSAGQGGRSSTFGSLLVGQYADGDSLRYVTHVGSGFDDRTLAALNTRLRGLATPDSPFAELPPRDGHPPATWVRPEVVVEVEFSHWTRDARLRAPVFLRIRDDKDPADVRFRPVEAPAVAPATDAAGYTDVSDLEAETARVLAQLEGARKQLTLRVEGHELRVANLDKVLWPATGDQRALTKLDLLVYFATAAPWLLPQLRDRPLTLTRYPNGIEGQHFYQKHYEEAPEYVERIRAYSGTNVRDQTYLLCNNLATLLWLGQVADLALHTSLARVNPDPDARGLSRDFTGSVEQIEGSLLNHPDFVLFDLDPYIYRGDEAAGEEPELNRAAWQQVCEVARWLKELLDSASLSSFVKTSGATGLHVYVPVVRNVDYATVRSVAETFASFLIRAHPSAVTTEWAVPKREGKVFFDVNQNARFKNLAAAYSPRAKPGAPVSMPLRWHELDSVYPTDFTILTAPDRVRRVGDLWANILDAKHDLSAMLGS
ncbi:MAG: non-homologous end-joining DNA ligase [Dehalococcoidia bacterium]